MPYARPSGPAELVAADEPELSFYFNSQAPGTLVSTIIDDWPVLPDTQLPPEHHTPLAHAVMVLSWW